LPWQGVAAADRAAVLDSGNSEVWVARANVSRAIDPTDMRDPIRLARRAIARDSGNANAWSNLALNLQDSGDLDAGLDIYRELVRRKPSFPIPVTFLAKSHYRRRQFDSAAFWADSSVALDPYSVLGRITAGYVAVERGNHAKGVAEFEAARRLSSGVEIVNTLAGRALVEARAGDPAKARATLRVVDSLVQPYVPPEAHTAVSIAQAYAALGDRDRAIQWLQYVARGELHFQLHMRCDPPFDPLKGDRRFQAIVIGRVNPPGSGC
jgi:tetratricopeptide (TPR) repeat protein